MAHFDNMLDLAKTQVALRALRYGHLPGDIFDEYAWDMMLHMFIAHLRGQSIQLETVVGLTSKNVMLGDRWVAHLVADRLVERDGDHIRLSDAGLARITAYHTAALDALED